MARKKHINKTIYFDIYEDWNNNPFACGQRFSFEKVEIRREDIYGYREEHYYDQNQNECRQILMDSSGSIKIPNKGTQYVYTHQGLWCSRNDAKTYAGLLLPPDCENSNKNKSRASTECAYIVNLAAGNGADSLRSCNVERIWYLKGLREKEFISLLEGRIIEFTTSYGKGHSDFVLTDGEKIFVLSGTCGKIKFINFEERRSAVPDFALQQWDSEDDIDFGMF